jgi:Zn-dependent peptidase ImmA (M78 family)
LTIPEVNKFKPAATALQVWNRYGLTAPSDLVLEDVAFALGVVVLEGRLDSADARLIRQGARGLIRVKEDIPEPGRKRFAVAHEIGHWLLHQTVSQVLSCTSEDMVAQYKGSVPEIEANDFAAELLMPAWLYRKKVGRADPSAELLRDLATYFLTTLTATAVRFVEVAEERCAMAVTDGGKVRWWRASERFDGFWLDAGAEVSPNTVAGLYFAGEPLPRGAFKLDGEEWLGRKAARLAPEVYEVAIPLGRYGQVISLLWPA